MSDDYHVAQARMDAEYEREYAAWMAQLSSKKRFKLMLSGVDAPLVEKAAPERKHEGPGSGDAAELPEASYTPQVAEKIEGKAGELATELGCTVRLAKRILVWHRSRVEEEAMQYRAFLFQRLIAGFLMPGNLRLRAAALAFAANLAALNGMGRSVREFARNNGFSPDGVAKVVRQWRADLNLPKSPHAKSDGARAAYSAAQKKKHWRNKRV